jgi:RNA polymerase sigma factor (sigma-70 family)
MREGQVQGILHYLRGLARPRAARDQTDRQLLQRFAALHDEAAFALLVERHGGLVWGACRRLLRHEQDAEDAFQAAFLVLARKAGTIPWRDDVGNWLYAVALRVARRAQTRGRRRRLLEQEAAAMPAREALDDSSRAELAAVLDEEVSRLPDKYRRPVVLCCLQGKTYTEAARLLGWPEGTVSGRLARARELLQRRLARRGLAVSGAGLTFSLAPVTGVAAPAALMNQTIKASLAFAAGPGEAAGPAAALVEGVLRTMSLTRLKTAGLALLALALVGTGIGVFVYADGPEPPAKAPQAQETKGAPKDRQLAPAPLPREWAGRWVANPFGGATAIEVLHGGGGKGDETVYVIQDAKALAALLKEVKITGVQNNIFPSCKPPSRLRVRYREGSAFEAGVMSGDSLTCQHGTLHLDPRFFVALNRRLSEQAKKPVDILKPMPALPQPIPPVGNPVEVKPSRQSLTAGFKSLGVTYWLGGQIHNANITDPKALATIHKALHILKEQPCTDEKAQSRNVAIWSKDGSLFYAQVLSGTEFFDFRAGRFTVRPEFFQALSREVSRLAGQPIDVCKDNALTERQVRRGQEFLKLLAEAKAFRVQPEWGTGGDLVIDEPAAVDKLIKSLRWVEVPAQEYDLPRANLLVELTTQAGKKVAIRRLNIAKIREAIKAGPGLADLVEVEGFGPLWLDSQWRQGFDRHVFQRDQTTKDRRDEETTVLVCRDLPLFWKQVLGVTAHYRMGDKVMHISLQAGESRAVVELLAAAKLERLDWSRERWGRELKTLIDREGGYLECAPGLGFSLELAISGEREMLIPSVGRLTFARSPLPALREAIDADRAKNVELLPRAK